MKPHGFIRQLGMGILPFGLLLTMFLPPAVSAQNRSLPATAPRSRQIIDLRQIDEPWAREWDITHTAVTFPDGGRAGFYQRDPRMGDAVPHGGRLGVLYLYPESDYKPARISRRHVEITPATSRLVIGACANRLPRGEWLLNILVDDKPLGEKVAVSGRDGWLDMSFNLSSYLGRYVDLEIQAHMSIHRASHVYIDYIELTGLSREPTSSLADPLGDTRLAADASSREIQKSPVFFDEYYENFINLLLDRQEKRRYDINDRYYYDHHYPNRRCPYYPVDRYDTDGPGPCRRRTHD